MLRLVNLSPVPAQLNTTPGKPFQRICCLSAKATFAIAPGTATLETQDPMPILDQDTPTPLGILPTDLLPPRAPGLDVMLLAQAHAPGDRPIESMPVTMRVGPYVQQMRVIGDRKWVHGAHAPVPTRPMPFTRMPLDWSRAMGGTVHIEIDRGAFIPMMHPLNGRGRGFDAHDGAQALAAPLNVPPGFPVVHDEGWLPNLEHPEHPVQRRTDDPIPWSWATVPIDIGMMDAERIVAARTGVAQENGDPTAVYTEALERMSRRAHPVWRIPDPGPAAPIELHGVSPHRTLAFALPRMEVFGDYVIGGSRTGTFRCAPYRVILEPEHLRMHLCFAKHFVVDPMQWEDSSVRLRIEHEGIFS